MDKPKKKTIDWKGLRFKAKRDIALWLLKNGGFKSPKLMITHWLLLVMLVMLFLFSQSTVLMVIAGIGGGIQLLCLLIGTYRWRKAANPSMLERIDPELRRHGIHPKHPISQLEARWTMDTLTEKTEALQEERDLQHKTQAAQAPQKRPPRL